MFKWKAKITNILENYQRYKEKPLEIDLKNISGLLLIRRLAENAVESLKKNFLNI